MKGATMTTSYVPRHLFSELQSPPVTVGDFIDAYLVGWADWHGAVAEYPSNSKTNEASNMAYALTDLRRTISVEPDGTPREIAELEVAELRPGDLRACLQQLVDRGLVKNGINARKNRILRWVRWLVEYEHADSSLLTRLEVVRGVKASRPGLRKKDRVREVAPEIVEQTVRCAPPVVQRAVLVQSLAGMRPGELIEMRVCLIRSGKNGVWDYTPEWHKTKNKISFKKVIPIGPEAQIELREQAMTLGAEDGLWGSTIPRLGDAQDRRRLWPWTTEGGYYQAIQRAIKRANSPHWFPNQLRHNTLTRAMLEADDETAASIAGHTNTRTVRRHYFHGQDEKARLWAEKKG